MTSSSTDHSTQSFTSSPLNSFLVGRPQTPSVQLSALGSTAGETAESAVRPGEAREVLENLKREDEEEQSGYRARRGALLLSDSKRSSLQPKSDQTADERRLLQKGIVLPRLDNSSQVMPSSSSTFTSSSSLSTNRSKDQYNGDMYVNDNITHQSLLSLNAVLSIPTDRSHRLSDRAGSPDSGYGNTPENALKLGLLSPNSRSRSCSSEASCTTADSSDRRTSPSSGHWSGHESALGLVAEEESRVSSDVDRSREANSHKDIASAGDGTEQLPLLLNSQHTSHSNTDPSPDDRHQIYHSEDDILLHMPSRTGRTSYTLPQQYQPRPQPHPPSEQARSTTTSSSSTSKRKGTWRKNRNRTVSSGRDSSLAGQEEKDYFQKTDELTKENAHFTLSEALLTVIEEYKSNLREEMFEEHLTMLSTASSSWSSTSTLVSPTKSDCVDGERSCEQDRRGSNALQWRQHQAWPTERLSSTSSAGSSSPSPSPPPPSPSPSSQARDVSLFKLISHSSDLTSAEAVSRSLLHHLGNILGGGRQVEFRVPQVVQLPTEFISSLQRDQELHYSFTSSATPMRGSHEWAPPRQQVIHSVQAPPLRNPAQYLERQSNRCAGCGMYMDPKQLKSYRFCNYMGKYFCLSCHHNSLCIIPALITTKWSFKKFVVSDFARDTLAKIENEALFDIQSLNPLLYERVPELGKAKQVREQLLSMKKYISSCSRAESVQPLFDQLGHLVIDQHNYSLNNFIQLKNGQLLKQLQTVAMQASRHIKSCLVCEGKGFVCELCQVVTDIIYPFELQRVSTCPDCQCCFHRDCHQENQSCPRCERIKERQRQRVREIMVDDDTGEL